MYSQYRQVAHSYFVRAPVFFLVAYAYIHGPFTVRFPYPSTQLPVLAIFAFTAVREIRLFGQ